MNTDKTEDNLRQLFHELREQDAQRAPSFDAVARPSASADAAQRAAIPWLRFAAGAAIGVLLAAGIALAIFRSRMHSSEMELQQWATLSNWKAPTDTLLNVPCTPWGSTTSTPSDSWIATATVSPDATKENL
jgi:hypothetical protein